VFPTVVSATPVRRIKLPSSQLHLGSAPVGKVEGSMGFVFCHFSGVAVLMFLRVVAVVVLGGNADVTRKMTIFDK
jgi:hypothetical protein